jgi:hypothetical protein
MDFYDFKSHGDLGSIKGEGSNTWGWVSDTGREFVAVGQVSASNSHSRSLCGNICADLNQPGRRRCLCRDHEGWQALVPWSFASTKQAGFELDLA